MNNNDEAIRIVFGRLDEQIRSNAEEGQPLFG
jgi:hypothetical protein